MALGATLRILGARGDVWLDEIWSLEMARVAGTVGNVLAAFHSDNNHYLNTLYIQAVGADSGPLALRALSIASGTAMIAVAAVAGSRDRAVALVWAFLLSASALLVHYGSEARGYAPAMFLAVTGYVAMGRLLETGNARWSAAFGLVAALGVLAHLSMGYVLMGFMAWAAAGAWRQRRHPVRFAAIALGFTPPALLLALLWAIDLRELVVGGGPEYRIGDVLLETARRIAGAPAGPMAWLGIPVLALAGAAWVRLVRARDLRWIFFAVACVVAPAAVLVLLRPPFLAPRYFLVLVPFLLLLVAEEGVCIARRNRAGLALSIAMAVLWSAGNAVDISRLLTDGRGQYRAALAYVAGADPMPEATVASDSDGRNFPLVDYHRMLLPEPDRIRYVRRDQVSDPPPTWFLIHRFPGDSIPGSVVEGPKGGPYELIRVFPHGGLSGWDWFLYRRRAPVGRD